MRESAEVVLHGANTLREDYEIGIQDGEFDVSYRASCKECEFQFTFETTQLALSPPRGW